MIAVFLLQYYCVCIIYHSDGIMISLILLKNSCNKKITQKTMRIAASEAVYSFPFLPVPPVQNSFYPSKWWVDGSLHKAMQVHYGRDAYINKFATYLDPMLLLWHSAMHLIVPVQHTHWNRTEHGHWLFVLLFT